MVEDARDQFAELVAALGAVTGGTHAARAARHVCRHADGGIRLLGTLEGEARAAFFDPTTTSVYTVPVSPVGVHPPGVEVDWSRVGEPGAWVVDRREELAWIHPRYRRLATEAPPVWRYEVDRSGQHSYPTLGMYAKQ